MYKLTLTSEERKAIDWVGYRYAHGTDLYKVLIVCEQAPNTSAEWDSELVITYLIPEHKAWRIKELCEESDYRLDCFADELREKLIKFCDQIV